MSDTGSTENSGFQEDAAPPRPVDGLDDLVLALDGFEGPIDLLLTLARDQKVDLAKISILALAEQYLAFVNRARELRLELAADYLVMAAWLAFLKSKLLLPPPADDSDEENPAEMAARLAFQLQRLEAMQKVSKELFARPRLGQEFFARGMPERLRVANRAIYEANLLDLMRVYGEIRRKQDVGGQLRIMPTRLVSMEQAARRLRAILGDIPDWQTLERFVPYDSEDPLLRRSAMASTFAASLELSKEGLVEIRQNGVFGTIYMRAKPGADLRQHDPNALAADEDPLDPDDLDLYEDKSDEE
ncbi:MAG: ScpA family protein [Alphaproteobacteria bacterium]|uniref:segregation and condensation protein A n=1 Tax=Pacificispira sp. TaxID=2888761 RepID=UPI002EA32628|nr:ScpA family protein [Pseudomonadota bacterium]